jgi:hypothetical protein
MNRFAGGLLLLVGLMASVPAVPANLAVISFVLGWATNEPANPDPWPSPDVPVRQIVLAWAIVTPLAIGGIKVGLRLLRGNRTFILFLRRFGHDDAQSAVAFAVLQTIGGSWRVVTLDDGEMKPIGIPGGTRRLFTTSQFAAKSVLAIAQFAGLRTFPVLVMAGWGILAVALAEPLLDAWRTGAWSNVVSVVERYFAILASTFERRLPIDAIGPTLPGVFALVVTAAAVSFAVLIVTMAALILALPLSTVLFFLSSSADAVRDAEKSKTMAVATVGEIRSAAYAIAQRSRKVFGPRLVILRVDSNVWRNAVREFVALSSLTLIDISEPTENVLWELEELILRRTDRCVVVGHYDRVNGLATGRRDGGDLTPVEQRLAALLHGREVLAYTADRRGLRRFARALRSTLLTLSLDAHTEASDRVRR